MEATIQFSPAIPIPAAPVDIKKRIQELHDYLDPNSPNCQPEQQHINIKAAIKLYEDGKIDGVEQVHITNEKVVSKEEWRGRSSWGWSEGIWHQHAYGHGIFGANFHEVNIRLFFKCSVFNFPSDSHATQANASR
jgi:hypothetical protein